MDKIYLGWHWTNISSWIMKNWFLISVIWLYERYLVALEMDSEVSMYGFGFLTHHFLAWFFFPLKKLVYRSWIFFNTLSKPFGILRDGFLFYLYLGWIYNFNEDCMRNYFMIWNEINLMSPGQRSRATCVTRRIRGNSIFSLPNNLNLFY